MSATKPIIDPDGGAEATTSGPVWTRHLRREMQYILDLGIMVAAFALAYLLRFDFWIPENYLRDGLVQLPMVVLLQFAVALLVGSYRFVWRYVGMSEVATFMRGAAYSATPLLLLRFGLPDAFDVLRIPLSVILMDTVLAFGGMLALRVLRRSLYETYERTRRQEAAEPQRSKPVLLVGAGRAGVLAVREITNRGDLQLKCVGFVDDDPRKRDTVIGGVPVLGTTAHLATIARRLEIDHVIITIANAGSETLRRIVQICERARIRVQIIPGLYEILDGRVSISRFRDIDIEDLLGREAVRLDEDVVSEFLAGRSVMITGAGGSIGSELCRQVARFAPARLLLVERAEGALFEIDRELRQLWPELKILPRVADVGDAGRMKKILDANTPEVILHAAAHKHVPMMELNPGEAIKNNSLASHTLGEVAGEAGVGAFVLISTDKAVRPSSVMGATKRIAELFIQDLDARYPDTRYVAVRFGNVMGSGGSVVPIFRQQIAAGGPVTVTHPEACRYFMTVVEATQLVLEAGALGGPGEILVLDMGRPVSILELAKDMIRLSGYEPFTDIAIRFTGLRPGEKLSEELALADEPVERTRNPKIYIGQINAYPTGLVREIRERLTALADSAPNDEIRAYLGHCLPEAQLDVPETPLLQPLGDDDAQLLH